MTAPTTPTTTLNLYTVRIGNQLRHIEGATAAEALATLSPEDRAAVYLISDDADLIFDSVTRPKIVASPQFQAATRSEKGIRWSGLILALARKFWILIVGGLIIAVIYALAGSNGSSGSRFITYMILFYLSIFAWLYLRISRGLKADKAINRDLASKNCAGVLKRLDAVIARAPAATRDQFERFYALHRVRALVGLERLADARAFIDKLAADPQTRPEAIRYFRATLAGLIEGPEAELEHYRLMTVETPHTTFGWLTYAEHLALEHDRPAEARAAFEHAKTLPIADPKRWQIDLIEGAVLIAEGRSEEALTHISSARAASPHSFLAKEAIHSVTPGTAAACMAIAHARLNQTADAVRELNMAFALLAYKPRPQLLERAQREVAACEQRTTSRGV
jgi:hypothetical protein